MVDVDVMFTLMVDVRNGQRLWPNKYWVRSQGTYGVQHPTNIIVRYCIHPFPGFAEFVKVGEGMDSLVEATREASKNDDIKLSTGTI